jgi:uncharacterized membrane protein YtjA (UPF0391 family)
MGPRWPILQSYPDVEAPKVFRSEARFCSLARAIFRAFSPRNLQFRERLFFAGGAEVGAQTQTKVFAMLGWVVTFLIVALIAGVLGFGGVAGASIEIAKIIFFIAVVLFLVSALVGVARGRTRI